MEMSNSPKQEREAFMGFTLSEEIVDKVTRLALSMGESEEAVVIPDTEDQVLVKMGTKAFMERKDIKEIFKIPIMLKTVVGGVEVEQLFFVCTE